MTDKEKELIDLYNKLLFGSSEMTPEIIIVPSEEGPIIITEKGPYLMAGWEIDEDKWAEIFDEDLLED